MVNHVCGQFLLDKTVDNLSDMNCTPFLRHFQLPRFPVSTMRTLTTNRSDGIQITERTEPKKYQIDYFKREECEAEKTGVEM